MPELSATHLAGVITSRRDCAPDLWCVRIKPAAPVPFKPGQYVSLGVKDQENDRVVERPYSICSAPEEDELEFFFELVPHGELTPRLHKLQPGDELLLRKKAKGTFQLDARTGHKLHYFITTVTGIAPCVSMVRHLAREAAAGRAPDAKLLILQGASRSWELAYADELRAAAAAHSSWLSYVPTISRPWEDEGWRGEVGRCEDLVRKYLDNGGMEPASTTAYLCGHPGMIENGKGIFLRRGFSREDIHVEVYWQPPKEVKSA
jgi:ferredoxin--NADP+ reductase